jgi:hypothetical protein
MIKKDKYRLANEMPLDSLLSFRFLFFKATLLIVTSEGANRRFPAEFVRGTVDQINLFKGDL